MVQFLCIGLARAQTGDARVLKTDSHAPYVHRLSLYDRDGKSIDPADPEARPYSPRVTCGKCHAYGEISCGWHFSAGMPRTPGKPVQDDGRPGEPWIYTDAPTGTRIPISLRDWDGAFRPEDIGLTPWMFAKSFGRHHTGGGFLEPDEKTIESQPEAARWKISGPLEIDCMTCHARGAEHDPAEIERQIERENFQWAPTAALGLAVIRGDAKSLPDDFDPSMPPPPGRPDLTPPQTVYEKSKFDGDNRALFDVVRQPGSQRCNFCHTVRPVDGPDPAAALRRSADVHLSAGLECTDCHRNGLDHAIERGLPASRTMASAAINSMSCSGCHNGYTPANSPSGGEFGAPLPEHRGIPPLHFDILSCSACHSGTWPDEKPGRVQTSMAHGLGIGSKDRTPRDQPEILQPFFASANSRYSEISPLTPYRAVWPSYWALQDAAGVIRTIKIDAVAAAGRKALNLRKSPRAGTASTAALTDEQIQSMLAALKPKTDDGSTAVYVRDGAVWRLSGDGKATHAVDGRLRPYLWPMAHDVRPARQSLGVRGCADCHADESAFFALSHLLGSASASQPVASPTRATSAPAGPSIGRATPANAWSPARNDPSLHSAWNRAFAMRDVFKVLGWAALMPLMAVVLAGLVRVAAPRASIARADVPTNAAASSAVSEPGERRATRWVALAAGVLVAATLVEIATGFAPLLFSGSPRGWSLLLHVVIAPVFILGLSALALAWSRRARRGRPLCEFVAWLTLTAGLLASATMLIAMLPWLGTGAQRQLIDWHTGLSAAFVLLGIVWIAAALPGRSRPKQQAEQVSS